MREIKFRAWNGEAMISPDYIDRNGLAHWKENSIPTSSDKLMQFTGLRDKNGKEIYEGDIVQVISTKKIYAPFEVILPEFWHGTVLMPCDNTSLLGLFEIIGNIYENPELLNKPGLD